MLQGSGSLVCVLTGGAGHKATTKAGTGFTRFDNVPADGERIPVRRPLAGSKRGLKRFALASGRLLAAELVAGQVKSASKAVSAQSKVTRNRYGLRMGN